MEATLTHRLWAIGWALVMFACGRGSGPEPGTSVGIGAATGTSPNEARIIQLIDERVTLALARDHATRIVVAGPSQLRQSLTEAAHAIRSPVQGSNGGETPAERAAVAEEIDVLAQQVDQALEPGSDVKGYAEKLQQLMDEIMAIAGTAAGDVEAVVMAAHAHVQNGIAMLESVQRARMVLEQVAAGRLPAEYRELATAEWTEVVYVPEFGDQGQATPVTASVGQGNPSRNQPARQGHVQGNSYVVEHEQYKGIKAEVLGLQHTTSGTLTLRFALASERADTLTLDWGTFHWTGPHDVALIDVTTNKRYAVLRDQAGAHMATRADVIRRLHPGERRELWAR